MKDYGITVAVEPTSRRRRVRQRFSANAVARVSGK
jgi:hypothetical protein